MNKVDALHKMDEGWQTLLDLLATFPESEHETTHQPDGWSINDVLAHITFWESYANDRLQEALRGEKPRLMGRMTDEELNALNQRVQDEGRVLAPGLLQKRFHQGHAALRATVEALPDDDGPAFTSLWPYPDDHWLLIEGDTWFHYQEHVDQINDWDKN